MLKNKYTNIKIGSFLTINIFFFPVAFLSLLNGYSHLFFSAFAIALAHELAHILTAKLMSVQVSHITVFPFGVAANLSNGYINKSDKEFFIAFAGPFLNIILFWIFRLILRYSNSSLIAYCADVNLAIGILNLTPALPLDGGRMLKSVLTARYGILRAYNFTIKLSRILVFVLIGISVCMFFASSFNFTLVLISAFLLQNLSREELTISHIAIKEILSNTEKTKNRDHFPTKSFSVEPNTRASTIMRLISYDYYCIFHILDSESKISKTLTETEVLAAMTTQGIRTTFGEI